MDRYFNTFLRSLNNLVSIINCAIKYDYKNDYKKTVGFDH